MLLEDWILACNCDTKIRHLKSKRKIKLSKAWNMEQWGELQTKPRKFNCKTNQWLNIVIHFWPRWCNGNPIYHPTWSNKQNGQNMRNNGFLTWDIRQQWVMITDRGKMNKVNVMIAPGYFLERDSKQVYRKGNVGRIQGLHELRESLEFREPQACQGHKIVGWRKESCTKSFRNLHKVPVESSVECCSVPLCDGTVQDWGKNHHEGGKGTKLNSHSTSIPIN